MIITLKKEHIDLVGFEKLQPFGIRDSYRWRDTGTKVDLRRFRGDERKKFLALLDKHKANPRIASLLIDVHALLDATKGGDKAAQAKPTKLIQFESMVTNFLKDAPGQRVYRQDDNGGWLPYYVSKISYSGGGRHSKPHVEVDLAYEKFGNVSTTSISFYHADCVYRPVAESCRSKGLVKETPALRTEYLATHEIFQDLATQIGLQCTATGFGDDRADNYSDGLYDGRRFYFGRGGEPSKVVVDVFHDGGPQKDDERSQTIDGLFWLKTDKSGSDDDAEAEDDVISEQEMAGLAAPEIPVHPYLAVFDLTRHLRLRTHVKNLTPYVYNDQLAERLVLPDEHKRLVQILVEHKDGGFNDVIAGKSGGAIVLLCGLPGTGKTMTAEVFAEHEHRPLYSVQCAQLGIDLKELEENLRDAIDRSSRWNAVLLLDEADVYVRRRGADLHQNAIVGTFLRILEYQSSVLFLTTNRPDDIDDAIASRCVARIDYNIPNKNLQKQIWQVLIRQNGVTIADKDINQIVESWDLSGRDVKNLLKLAMLLSGSKKLAFKDIEYVKRFKPTNDLTAETKECT
jgi:AAA+ superfamily predicted ATPase